AGGVGGGLGGDDVLMQPAGGDQPAQPQRRSEGLGAAAGVGDPVRREALQGRHGRAIVAVLGVVVVFNDQPAGRGPVKERAAALGSEHYTGGELVGGGDQHRLGAGVPQRSDVKSSLVDGDRGQPQSPAEQLA